MNRDHDATFRVWNLWKNAATLIKFSKKCILRGNWSTNFCWLKKNRRKPRKPLHFFWNANDAKFLWTLRKIFARQFFWLITTALGPPPPTIQLSQYVPCLTLSFPYLSVTGTLYSIYMVKCKEPGLCYTSWKRKVEQHDSEFCVGLFLYYFLNDSGHPSAGEPQFGPDDPRRARVLSVVDPRFAIFNAENIIKPF